MFCALLKFLFYCFHKDYAQSEPSKLIRNVSYVKVHIIFIKSVLPNSPINCLRYNIDVLGYRETDFGISQKSDRGVLLLLGVTRECVLHTRRCFLAGSGGTEVLPVLHTANPLVHPTDPILTMLLAALFPSGALVLEEWGEFLPAAV